MLVSLATLLMILPPLSSRVSAAGETTFIPTKRDADGRLIGDIDGNGAVTGKDRLILERFLAGWDGYDKWFREDGSAPYGEGFPAGGEISLCEGDSYQIETDSPAVTGWFAADQSVAAISSTGRITAKKAGTTVVRAYDAGYNTIGGIYTIHVSQAETGDYTVSFYSGPTKKIYRVGEQFDQTGLYITVLDKDNRLIALLNGESLQVWPYFFKDSDLSADGKTTTITVSVNYQNKVYSVQIPGLTVLPALPTLNVRTTTGNMIYSMTVELKKDRYPIGSSLSLADIDRVYGLDANSLPFVLTYADLAGYTNTFSLEVAAVNSRGETSRKIPASSRATITSDDIFTASDGSKYAYLRFYIDNCFTEFEVRSGESPVSVYSSNSYSNASLLGIFDSLSEALADVNNIDHQWGSSSSSTIAATRTLYIRLGQNEVLGRDVTMTPARNIEIELNGCKLAMYSDTFRFPDETDTCTVTVTNNSSVTGRIVYSDMNMDNLLIDKPESIIYKYRDNSSIPGIYTVTVEETKNGTVTTKPALSDRNTVTIAHGNDVTFTIIPDKDFAIDTVKARIGEDAYTTVSVAANRYYSLNSSTGVATYTLKDVRNDAALTATFKAVEKWINPFTDVNSYASYYEAVLFVYKYGLVNGMTQTTFGPNHTMTRAQFVTTLGRMYLSGIFQTTAEKDAAMIAQYGTDSKFSDVSYSDASLSYAVPYIKWAESTGLALGDGNGKFRPKDTITHEEMYLIMLRYAVNLCGKSVNVNNVTLRAVDASDIGIQLRELLKDENEAIVAAKYAQQQGFLVKSTQIDPAGNALRYEIAILLRQFCMNVLGWE